MQLILNIDLHVFVFITCILMLFSREFNLLSINGNFVGADDVIDDSAVVVSR